MADEKKNPHLFLSNDDHKTVLADIEDEYVRTERVVAVTATPEEVATLNQKPEREEPEEDWYRSMFDADFDGYLDEVDMADRAWAEDFLSNPNK